MNEETIAGVVGWGKTVGCIASSITVDLCEPGHVRRAAGKSGTKHTVFRTGEVHGRVTDRVKEICRLVGFADSAMVTENLWGERWSKLVQNGMGNGVTAATGLTSPACLGNDRIRRFQIALAGEGVRVGQALGFQLEKIRGVEPEKLARAAEGDREALAAVESVLIPKAGENPRADIQRPSMAQDILKGRRTEIEQMNGYIARKGAEVGVSAPSHMKLTELVLKIERGELKPSASHLGG
jgi:2-dehydropantoate 2-reductase